MRAPALLLFAALLATGCVSQAGTLDPAADEPAPGPGEGADVAPETADEEDPQFCESEEGCAFWDEDYHEYVLYNVDTARIDVIVVPSASADATSDTPLLKAAVDAWAEGAQALGAEWFTSNFSITTYLAGTDEIPAEAREDPEIIVLAAEYNPVLLFGIGLEPKQFSCMALGESTIREYPVHAHHGMRIYASDCTGIGFVCFAVNTNFLLGSGVYLQDLVAHEVGHCLGGGHVGDALDFKAKRVPVQDVMSYQHDEEQIHCVSTLNIRVLEALYAPVIGAEVEQPVSAGDYYTMPRADYDHVPCGAMLDA